MEMVVTTGAIRRAKLQSKWHNQQTNTQFKTISVNYLDTVVLFCVFEPMFRFLSLQINSYVELCVYVNMCNISVAK